MNLGLMKRVLPYLGIAVGLAVAYDGYVFYSRWSERHDAERLRSEQETANAKKVVSLVGGAGLKITMFYASPGAIRKGSTATVCYGTTDAAKVRIEPPVADVWPSMNHCLQVSPLKTTDYKLTAADAAGHSVSESFVLQVVR